jgi:hypothetical protein
MTPQSLHVEKVRLMGVRREGSEQGEVSWRVEPTATATAYQLLPPGELTSLA